jgi:hypothetical protein
VRAELVAECPPFGAFLGRRSPRDADRWHVNWISPGDGLARNRMDTSPDSPRGDPVAVPRRHDISGLAIFGYEDEIILACISDTAGRVPVGHEGRSPPRHVARVPRGVSPRRSGSCAPDPVAGGVRANSTRWKTTIDLSRNEVPLPLAGGASGEDRGRLPRSKRRLVKHRRSSRVFPFARDHREQRATKWTRDGAIYRLSCRDRMTRTNRTGSPASSFPRADGEDRRKAVAIDIPVD